MALTLDHKPGSVDKAVSPLVSYVSGLLLGTNSKVRTWFGMFIRNGQQVRVYICFVYIHCEFTFISIHNVIYNISLYFIACSNTLCS